MKPHIGHSSTQFVRKHRMFIDHADSLLWRPPILRRRPLLHIQPKWWQLCPPKDMREILNLHIDASESTKSHLYWAKGQYLSQYRKLYFLCITCLLTILIIFRFNPSRKAIYKIRDIIQSKFIIPYIFWQ